MRVSPLLVWALCCAAPAHVGVGQARYDWATLPPRTELRVRLLDSTTVVGRFAGLEQDRMRLNTVVRPTLTDSRLVPRTVALDSIAAVWANSGTRWKRGAVIGAAVGAAGLVLALGIDQSRQDGSSCSAWCWTSVAATGALAGALFGAAVGHQFVVWRPVTF